MGELNTDREVIRCRSCGLVQYVAASGRCRKCHGTFDAEALAPAATLAPPTAAVPQPAFSVAIPLKRTRLALGLSQLKLANRLGVPRTYISKMENGRCVPGMESIARLAEALGVSMADLVEDERGKRAKRVAELLADPFLAEIAEALPRIGRTERQMLLIEVEKLADYNTRAARRGKANG